MLTTIGQAQEYFFERCKSFGIDENDIYKLWINAQNIIVQAYVFIALQTYNDENGNMCIDAFLETTCNGIINAWEIGESEKRF